MATAAQGDGRRTPRQKVLLAGKIVCAEGVSFDCVIRDRSESGARLKRLFSEPFPSQFHLIDVRAGHAHACEVTWAEGGYAGVRFDGTWDVSSPSCPPSLARLRQLWLECAPRSGDA